MQRVEQARAAWVSVTVLALAPCGCGDAREQAVASNEAGARANDPVASTPTVASASAAPVATPAKPPLLKLVKAFPEELKGLGSVYQLNGHLLIVDGTRVVHVAGQKLELVADQKGDGPFGGQPVIPHAARLQDPLRSPVRHQGCHRARLFVSHDQEGAGRPRAQERGLARRVLGGQSPARRQGPRPGHGRGVGLAHQEQHEGRRSSPALLRAKQSPAHPPAPVR